MVQVATGLFHTVAVMSSNEVIGCGQNDEGQIRPDLPGEAFLPRASLLRPARCQRVTQASYARRSRNVRDVCDLFMKEAGLGLRSGNYLCMLRALLLPCPRYLRGWRCFAFMRCLPILA